MTRSPTLPSSTRTLIAQKNNTVAVSAASAWEIAIKVRLGKLGIAADLCDNFGPDLVRAGFYDLAVTVAHGIRAGSLPGPHRDPFDRMLIAQAQAENLAIVSNDAIFDSYGVSRLW
jgi:PIN domain nuclease of toxin-antitoxin system